MKPNFIAGQWLDSAASVANINPSDTRDTIDHYAQADAGMAEAAIAAAHEAKAAWGFCSPQARADALDRIGAEILARREELGRLLSREEGKTLPEGIGEVTRAGNIFVLRRRGPAPARRQAGLGQAGHRDRRDARTRGHGRHHRALELPDRHSRLENRARAGLWQHSRVQARRTGAWLRLGAGRDHQPGRAAGGRLQPGDGSRLTGGSGPAGRPPHRRHLLHRFGRHGPARGAGRRATHGQGAAGNGRQESDGGAGRRRPGLGSGVRGAKRVLFHGAAARHRAGSSSSKASTRASCRSCGTARPRSGSATRWKPEPTSAPSPAATNWNRTCATWTSAGRKARGCCAAAASCNSARRATTWRPPSSRTATTPCASAARKFGPVAAVMPARDYEHALALANDTEFGLASGICSTSLKHVQHFSGMRRPAW